MVVLAVCKNKTMKHRIIDRDKGVELRKKTKQANIRLRLKYKSIPICHLGI